MHRSHRRLLFNAGLGTLVAGLTWFGAHLAWVQDDPPARQGRGGPRGGGGRDVEGPPFTLVDVPWLAAPFLVLLAAGVALRWRYPRLAFVAVVTGVGGFFATGASFPPVLLAPALVVYPLATTVPPRRWLPLTALLVPMVLAAHVREPYLGLLGPGLYASLFAGAAVAVLPALVAVLRRSRREADRYQRDQDRRRYAYEERLRIAQEVHDVVGHSLAVVTMQAGVALHVLDKQGPAGQPATPEVRRSLEAIRRTSREAMAELRTTLGVFREPDGGEPRAPRPGLARLDELVGALRQAGRRIELVREPGAGPLPAAVDQAAFRIIQEGLTNVVRHAGDAAATVRVTQADGRLAVEVADDGPGGPLDEEGNGIRGMRERARAVGGTVTLGPRASGGLLLRAELPLTPSPPAGPAS